MAGLDLAEGEVDTSGDHQQKDLSASAASRAYALEDTLDGHDGLDEQRLGVLHVHVEEAHEGDALVESRGKGREGSSVGQLKRCKTAARQTMRTPRMSLPVSVRS